MVTSTFDHWPVLVFTISGEVSAADVDAIIATTTDAFARRGKHVNIFDCRRVIARPDALIRQKMAKFTNDSRDNSKAWTLGTAIIVESAILRGVLTAIHWVAPPSVPVEAVGTFEQAIDHARSWLQTVNLSLSVDATVALKKHGIHTAVEHASKVGT